MQQPVRFDIPSPCHQPWQQMTPVELGRHCGNCRRTVVDFTSMTDQEVLQFMKQATTSVCGRFSHDQLKKTYAPPKKKNIFSVRYAWGALVSAYLLASQPAAAHTKAVTEKACVLSSADNGSLLPGHPLRVNAAVRDSVRPVQGIITDAASGLPLEGVVVMIKGTRRGTMTDSTGHFALRIDDQPAKVMLVASMVGYKVKEIPVGGRKRGEVRIRLKAYSATLGEVVIIE